MIMTNIANWWYTACSPWKSHGISKSCSGMWCAFWVGACVEGACLTWMWLDFQINVLQSRISEQQKLWVTLNEEAWAPLWLLWCVWPSVCWRATQARASGGRSRKSPEWVYLIQEMSRKSGIVFAPSSQWCIHDAPSGRRQVSLFVWTHCPDGHEYLLLFEKKGQNTGYYKCRLKKSSVFKENSKWIQALMWYVVLLAVIKNICYAFSARVN